jgi:catechol 2,3-dioxygenase-like lactoylglutathione lyase family enzyme
MPTPMQMPKIASALNHVAYPTTNTAETVRFYTEVMGFRLAHAVRSDVDPESGNPRPFLHTFFEMGNGEIIAFFDIAELAVKPQDDLPRWVRHLALAVDSKEAIASWKTYLESHGLHVSGPVDHDGVWLSIYFGDPNGVTLELTHQSRALVAHDAEEAAAMVATWNAERTRAA